jgi:hypothetical protein
MMNVTKVLLEEQTGYAEATYELSPSVAVEIPGRSGRVLIDSLVIYHEHAERNARVGVYPEGSADMVDDVLIHPLASNERFDQALDERLLTLVLRRKVDVSDDTFQAGLFYLDDEELAGGADY